MKRQYTLSILITFIVNVALVCNSYGQLTESQKFRIISKADSVINLYNSFGTFVTEVGYFSPSAARDFKALFDENAGIINDLDIDNENNNQFLKPEVYINYAQANFEKGLSDATFTKNESETIITNTNITVIGTKSLSAELNVNGLRKLFKREYKDFQIVISFDKGFNKFMIAGTSRSNIKVVPPNEGNTRDHSIQIVNSEGKAIPAKASLSVNGNKFAMMLTNEAGYVNFSEIPTKSRVTLDVTGLEDPSYKFYSDESATDFFNRKTAVLTKEEKIKFTFRVQDKKNLTHIAKAKISVEVGGEKYSDITDKSGSYSIPAFPGDKVLVTVTADRYNEYTENLTLQKKDRTKTIYLTYIQDDQFVKIHLIGGAFLSNQLSEHFSSELSKSPVLGLSGFYERLPYQKEKKDIRIGYYGSFAFSSFKFTLDENSTKREYEHAYEDIDGDVATLIINTGKLTEEYSMTAIGLSGGLLVRKTFPSLERLSLTGYLGPELNLIPLSNNTFSVDSMSFSGRYASYYNMELRDIDRYGYSTKNYNNSQSGYFNPLVFGLALGVNTDYMINDKLGIGVGVNYKKYFSNLLKEQETRYAAGIRINNGIAENYYDGLVNELEKFKLDSFTLSFGVTYKLK